jgi:putative transcriptional regulator
VLFGLLLLAPSGWGTARGSAARQPRAGTLLIASRDLLDPNFAQTVVLLLQAGEEGAVGVIINRRTTVPVAAVLPTVDAFKERGDALYTGGPVEIGRVSVLVRTSSPPPEATPVLTDVYLVKGNEGLEYVLRGDTPESALRVFAGYAGWAPGQLEAEIAVGGWHLLPASPRWLFDEEPAAVWPELIEIASLPVA